MLCGLATCTLQDVFAEKGGNPKIQDMQKRDGSDNAARPQDLHEAAGFQISELRGYPGSPL